MTEGARLPHPRDTAPGDVPDIVVSGEVVADLIAAAAQPEIYRFHVGGQGANVAHALARLGLPTTLLMPLSRDALGERFLTALSAAGVRLPLAASSDMPTSVPLVSLQEGQPRYSLYRDGVADRDLRHEQILAALPRHPAVHVLGAFCYAVEPDRSFWLRIADESRRRGALLSSDPNIRAAVMDRAGETPAGMLRALRESDIVKASDEDLAWLFPGVDSEVAAARLFDGSRTRLVVLTAGDRGSVLLTRSSRARVPSRPARPFVDAVGAGDTYHAALLQGLMRAGVRTANQLSELTTDTLAAVGRMASLAASLTCERSGCEPPSSDRIAAAR